MSNFWQSDFWSQFFQIFMAKKLIHLRYCKVCIEMLHKMKVNKSQKNEIYLIKGGASEACPWSITGGKPSFLGLKIWV